MTTLFVVCFIAGLGLSVISFVSGSQHVNVFDHVFHGHHALPLPRGHHAHAHGRRGGMINAAAITAFLTWFGGGGLLLQRLTPLASWLIVVGAFVMGLAGGTLINRFMNSLSRGETTAQSLSMIGVIGKTVIPIREGDGTGEIVFTHAGTKRVAGARSDTGRAVAKGTEVIVTRYEKGIAYVATWEELGQS